MSRLSFAVETKIGPVSVTPLDASTVYIEGRDVTYRGANDYNFRCWAYNRGGVWSVPKQHPDDNSKSLYTSRSWNGSNREASLTSDSAILAAIAQPVVDWICNNTIEINRAERDTLESRIEALEVKEQAAALELQKIKDELWATRHKLANVPCEFPCN